MIRLIYEQRGARVFILSNIPDDIEVDKLFMWERCSLIQQLVDEAGVFIPLNKTHLTANARYIRTASVWLATGSKRSKLTWVGISQLAY
tara:strand:- start:850 stop:1116 length:267 start_codon:yes stop_codon:yes gene_type:complete